MVRDFSLDHKGRHRRHQRMRKQARLIRPPSPLGARLIRTFRCSTIRTGRGSTVKAAIDFSLDHKGPIFFRGGATHYSDGEGSLTIHMVRDFSLDC